MQTFQYVARDTKGLRKQGVHQAAASAEVVSWLREQGLTAIAVDQIDVQARPKARRQLARRIKSSDLAALCWQLATMIEGGVPLTDAIASIKQDATNSSLEFILGRILEKISRGQTLANSIDEFPHTFNVMSRAIILAGESSGTLAVSLRRLGEYYDTRDKLKKKVQMATAYPIFVVSFICIIIIVIMTFIIPRFRAIFAQFHGKLPAFTEAFIGFYDLVRLNALYVIGVIALVVAIVVGTTKFTKSGHTLFSRFVLKIPILGRILSEAFVVTLCRTMSTLLSSGISVLEVFDILAGMTKNDVIKNAIVKAKKHIVEGTSISYGMAEAGFFPNVVIKMVDVGEKSGSISRVLERTADYYERKVDAAITTLMSLLEPLLIITVGAIVLTVAIALYLPIFQMSEIH